MRKWFSGLLTVCLTVLLAAPVSAALPSGTGIITNSNSVSGSEFSSKSSIAKKLDKMFAGDIGLYKDSSKTKLVDASLGTRNVPNNGVYQYWGPAPRAGTSCFAYANAFYGHFYDGVYPHHSLNSNHKKIKATGKISYANFVKWGVRDDAAVYIREGNHSIIVLTYNKNYITYVDGNGDAKGLIAIRKEAWKRGSGANIYNQKPSLIVQPTTKYFPAGNMKTQGLVSCTQGGNSHDWDEGTVTKKATCKETGLKVYTCLDCGITNEKTVAKTSDHTYGEWAVTKEATCSKKGTKAARCTLCGKEKTKSIKALGHKYGKAVVTQEATISSPGITKKTCERCGKVSKTKSDCVYQNEDFGITLTTQEGVFPKNTELLMGSPENLEDVQVTLRSVTAEAFLFVLDAWAEEEHVQPNGTFTLKMEIPENLGTNLAFYKVTEGEPELLESAIDLEARILTAELQSCGIFALCDLDIPWVPEPTEITQPETEPATETATEATVAAMEQKEIPQHQNIELFVMIAVVAILFVALMILIVILAVRKGKKTEATPLETVEGPAEETLSEEKETPEEKQTTEETGVPEEGQTPEEAETPKEEQTPLEAEVH